jgi:hypothetical protein
MMMSAQSADTFSMAKYLVQGTVRDDQGLPVEGAALRIGRDLAYTDSAGHFLVRFSRHGPFPLRVVPEEFLASVVYEVVSAPSEVEAESPTPPPAISKSSCARSRAPKHPIQQVRRLANSLPRS